MAQTLLGIDSVMAHAAADPLPPPPQPSKRQPAAAGRLRRPDLPQPAAPPATVAAAVGGLPVKVGGPMGRRRRGRSEH